MADNKTIGRLTTMVCTPADNTGSGSSPVQQRLDQLDSQYDDHVSGRNPLPPEQSLWLRGEIDRLSQIVHPGQQSLWPAYSPLERQYLAQQAAQHERDANTLGMALLGPVFGGPAAAVRNLGAPESVVSGLNEFGFNVAGAVALGGIGRGEVVDAARWGQSTSRQIKYQSKELNEKYFPRKNTGVVVRKIYSQLDWKAVIPKKGQYKGQSREDHVRLHNVDNLSKPDHGVFIGDGVDITNQAWQRAQDLNIAPDINGTLTVPMGTPTGYAGGYNATPGNAFNSVTIKVIPGTNKLVTSFPTR
jgi:hypothetical protein